MVADLAVSELGEEKGSGRFVVATRKLAPLAEVVQTMEVVKVGAIGCTGANASQGVATELRVFEDAVHRTCVGASLQHLRVGGDQHRLHDATSRAAVLQPVPKGAGKFDSNSRNRSTHVTRREHTAPPRSCPPPLAVVQRRGLAHATGLNEVETLIAQPATWYVCATAVPFVAMFCATAVTPVPIPVCPRSSARPSPSWANDCRAHQLNHSPQISIPTRHPATGDDAERVRRGPSAPVPAPKHIVLGGTILGERSRQSHCAFPRPTGAVPVTQECRP